MNSEEKSSGESSEPEPTFHLRDRTVSRFWSLFFLTVLLVLFLVLLWKAVSVFLLLLAGVLVAIALRFISDRLAQWTGMGPRWSLTLVILVVFGGGLVAGILGAPAIFGQLQELASNLRESLLNLEKQMRQSQAGNSLLQWIGGMGGEEVSMRIWSRIAGFFTTTFGAVTSFFLTLVIGVFFAYNPRLYVCGFLRLIPVGKRKRASEILRQMADTLRWWMVGQLISMMVLAVSTWLVLWVLGIPLAAILGVLTGVLTFIPYLGPLIALAPILLIAFIEGPTVMVWVLVAYLIIQNLESNVLMPIIFQKTVHLPPVLTIIAQILLGAIFGFIGIVLATPLMAAGIDLVRMIYVEDVLGDSMKKPCETF